MFLVKRMIRNKATHAYLSAEGHWVGDYRLAQDFENTMSVFRAVGGLKVKDLELVLMIGPGPSEAYDITLPLST